MNCFMVSVVLIEHGFKSVTRSSSKLKSTTVVKQTILNYHYFRMQAVHITYAWRGASVFVTLITTRLDTTAPLHAEVHVNTFKSKYCSNEQNLKYDLFSMC
jgi:hypothetical protein